MAADDADRKELQEKVSKLVNDKFQGNYQRAFQHYDGANSDGTRDEKIVQDELIKLLADADVGYKITRWKWAEKIILALDKDGDGAISWGEFQAMLKSGG